MSLPDVPPPVSVARNQWTDIPVPELGQWDPTRVVSIVLPYYERSRELNLTLAGLAEQTYPHHLLQVIVVDDGSPTDPPQAIDGLPFDVQVVTQEDQGYGLTRARNLGAKVAEGGIVVFLDCDMIPERQHIEGHARWHHAASRLVTHGFRFHADFDHVTSDEVSNAVREGRIRDLLADQTIQRPEWIEKHIERTNRLLGPHEDLYLIMSGGNLGIDRDLYWEAGGNDESFTRWGGEDNEFAYRVLQLGAVVVPERSAVAWHQGEGHEPSQEEFEAIWLQRAKMRNLIPDRSIRVESPGRGFVVPFVTAFVDPNGKGAEEIGVTIESLLANDFTDLVVGVGGGSTPDDAAWLHGSYSADPRVHLEQTALDLEQLHPFSPVRMELPAGYGVDRYALGPIVSELGGAGVGAINITLPGASPRDGVAALRLTRARNRARHVDPDALNETIGRLFGERWLSGAGSGFWAVEDLDEARARIRQSMSPLANEAQLSAMSAQLSLKSDELVRLRSRRALRLADAFGSVARSRSWKDLRAAVRAVMGAVRG